MALKDLLVRHRRLVIAGSVAGVGLLIFVLVWFQPQKLFQNVEVTETLPPAASPSATDAMDGAGETTVLVTGAFQSHDHTTTGRASILELADGRRILRFESLQTDNGPDLRVYLSAVTADAQGREFAEDFYDVGVLKGNRGDQNYEIPADVDLSRYRSVVIWCVRFTVPFGAATLA